jgi:hypothetical protein
MRDFTEAELDAIDSRVPKLLDVLGQNLLRQLECRTTKETFIMKTAVQVLRCAHHLHETYGATSLAKLYALPLYADPTVRSSSYFDLSPNVMARVNMLFHHSCSTPDCSQIRCGLC